ncbi:hypothetical protein T05_3992 [Trichinella murrelli]|uniref:Uncharacterized protein n=1 Tax=Trichinella murrelli TaxID=144512 RepID=A0A0V0TXK3_9BILA|nr:hypothetical protein T05_3992 [Trichinella murrelli]
MRERGKKRNPAIEAFPCPWARWEMKDAQFRLASSLGSVQLASRQIVNLRVRTHS